MEYKINNNERENLRGLPYLQRLLYLIAIRPYMDYSTGIVGLKRGISYQSLAEEMYVEPHQGYQSGSPSRSQIRRALRGLEKAGLIQSQNYPKKLVFKCLLATWDNCVQNKVVTKPSHQGVTKQSQNLNKISNSYEKHIEKADIGKTAKAVIPPVSGNYIIFLEKKFDIFWTTYPEKKSKQKAWAIFQSLNPTAELFEKIMAGLKQQILFCESRIQLGEWVPNWKYPANWLEQACWEETVEFDTRREEKRYAGQQQAKRQNQNTVDILWESCKSGFAQDVQAEQTAEIFEFTKYKDR